MSVNAMRFSGISGEDGVPPQDVDLLRYSFKMVGIHTQWNLTKMVQLKPLWNSPLMEFIGKAMGKIHTVAVKIHSSITLVIARSTPQPTSIALCRFIYPGPESFLGRPVVPVMARNIVSRSALDHLIDGIVTIANSSFFSTAALTKAKRYARMFLHLESPIQIWGAALRAVCTSAGAFA